VNWLDFDCLHRYPGGFELQLAFAATEPLTALFGPSGSGKTSVLSMIAGFVRPVRGRIGVYGRPTVDTAGGLCLAPEQRHVGFVFQDHLLFPHLTVQANLSYGQRRRRGPRAVDMTRAIDVLELGGLLGRYPRSLSGGESQRVALGRALLSSPELLLMDEPLTALDEPLKLRILNYVERVVAEWHVPTLFVSHDQAAVRRLASWVVVIERGRLVAAGRPDEALGQPAPLGFKNSAGPANLVRIEQCTVRDGHWVGRLGDQDLHLPPQDRPPALPLFVEFSPNDVTLSRIDVSGLSARNHLRGHVRHTVPLPEAVFVAVDVGQIIWSAVTPEAATELQLQLGAAVTCLIKTHSLRIVS
jgi:molybdate transport system ATP-binding protein